MLKQNEIAAVDLLIWARQSVRAFLPDPVEPVLINEILDLAARAPSGSNIQPWRVHVLTGKTLTRLTDAACDAFDANDGTHQAEYDYYPPEFFEPYKSRRRKLGWDLYGLLGIGKRDSERMASQLRRNFSFFDAPVGLIFTIDRRMSQGCLLDYGMFLQTLMLAAQVRGLSTCAQGAWIDYHRIVSDQLELPYEEQLVCGMALGYADYQAPENRLQTQRAVLNEFVVRHD